MTAGGTISSDRAGLQQVFQFAVSSPGEVDHGPGSDRFEIETSRQPLGQAP
jgi:hypothetical protein